jgi:tetratricopeptide (TPR) repeat protein
MARPANRYSLLLVVVFLPGALSAQTPDSGANAPAAAQPATAKRPTRTDSIVVSANLTPEEIEDGRINDVYQPLYHLKQPADCAQIIELSEKTIIPMAERSQFVDTKNKYLFLANRDVAGCELATGKYQEAEARYQKLFDYLPVWPGIEDSDYPQNYREIGLARLMQSRWKDAEGTLEKSIEIFDTQINKAARSDSEFEREGMKKNLMMSEAQARKFLAMAYFRDDRQREAMEMLDKAYDEAVHSNATAEMIQRIVESGQAAAKILGDETAEANWDARVAKPQKTAP